MSQSDDRPRKAVSEKKRAANRANASKSTGPKTEAGKARVSLNALTHGMTAATAVLPTENEDHFNKFAAALRAELKPRGFLQTLIAERLVEVAWKQRRAAKALTEHACRRLDTDLDEWERARELGAWKGPDIVLSGTEMLVDSAEGDEEAAPFLRLELYADRLQRAFHQGLTQLRREQRRAVALAQESGGDVATDAAAADQAADVAVALENDPLENGRFENKATADLDANEKPVNLKNYWVDLSVQESLFRGKQLDKAKAQNKATAVPVDAAVSANKPVEKPPAANAGTARNPPPAPVPPEEGEKEPEPEPPIQAPAVDAVPDAAATGKPNGIAQARDVGMGLSGERPGEIDPLRQLPPSHPLYRGPRRGGG